MLAIGAKGEIPGWFQTQRVVLPIGLLRGGRCIRPFLRSWGAPAQPKLAAYQNQGETKENPWLFTAAPVADHRFKGNRSAAFPQTGSA
jgi:hypothetical protein